MSRIKDRTGEFGVSNSGERMTIIRYGGKNDIDVKFDDGTVVEHKQYNDFKRGKIKNPYFPNVYGVGFVGIGDYKSVDENGKNTKCYMTWHDVHKRCYDPKWHKKEPSYKNCRVCQLWNNSQEFAKWNDENYYEVGNERMNLDKIYYVKEIRYIVLTLVFMFHSRLMLYSLNVITNEVIYQLVFLSMRINS